MKFVALVFILLVGGCNQNSTVKNQPNSGGGTGGSGGTSGSGAGGDVTQSHFKDPSTVAIGLTEEVTIADSVIIAGYKVPTLKFDLKDADFVQVIRCAASYDFRTPDGRTLRDVQGQRNFRDLRGAWFLAIADSLNCKIIGERVITNPMPDLTSPTGSFYYVANPCIDKESSKSYKTDCSYDLKKSASFSYTNTQQDNVLKKIIEINGIQAELNGYLITERLLIARLANAINACENLLAQDQSLNSFKRGLMQMGFLIAGFVVGGVIGSFTPMGAWNMAIMLGMISGTAFFELANSRGGTRWPAEIQNECVDPDVKATTQAERDAAVANDRIGAEGRFAGKYEEAFRFGELTKQLEALIEPQNGPIASATKKFQEAQQELFLLQANVMLYNEGINKFTQGASIKDLSTLYEKALDLSSNLNTGTGGGTGSATE